MTNLDFLKPFRGIITPMVTPLKDRDTLDIEGMERLIEHIVAGGVHGLFVVGTSGEGTSLSYRLRKDVLERACRQVAGRVPVLVGITDTSLTESVNLAREAEKAGARAVVHAGPCYYPITQRDILDFINRLAPELPLPLFLYNMPSHTRVTFEVETVLRAAEHPQVVGLKDSSGNLLYFFDLCQACRPDFSLLMGPEELLGPAMLFGAHGGVSGGANLCPELYVSLYNAAVAGNLEEVRSLHKKVMQIRKLIYRVGEDSSSYLKGLKCALSVLGICDDFMAEPLSRFREPERDRIRAGLTEIGLQEVTAGGSHRATREHLRSPRGR